MKCEGETNHDLSGSMVARYALPSAMIQTGDSDRVLNG
jgi:hypothetical protein